MSVLDESREYSEQLKEMADLIIEQEKKGKKDFNKEDIVRIKNYREQIENDILMAYKNILSVFSNPNDISKAVSNLVQKVSNSGTTEVSKISSSVIQETLRNNEIHQNINNTVQPSTENINK